MVAAIFTVFAAGVVRGFSGFGDGLVMIPLLSILYGPPQAVAIGFFTGFIGVLFMAPKAWSQTVWRSSLPVALAAVPATPLGVWLLVSGEPEMMRKVPVGVGRKLGRAAETGCRT